MNDTLSKRKADAILAAFDAGLMAQDEVVSLIDFDGLRQTISQLTSAFPSSFTHSFAVKANYYVAVLKEIERSGMSVEVAGIGEMELALAAGFPGPRIVFDAPIKTKAELKDALDRGVHLNIDNFQELEIVSTLLQEHASDSVIGIRINPQVGAGDVVLSSTATMTSKFGVGLQDKGIEQKLLDAYQMYPWLNAIHVHVGSVGCPLELMSDGIAKVAKFADKINQHVGSQQVHTIDMGGGLPVDFSCDEMNPTFDEYASLVMENVPQLRDGTYQGVTEFGRAVIAKNAMTLARVEYTKLMGGRHIALTHAGAHNMMRIVFQPETWARRATALSSKGVVKSGEKISQDIAGPCCFAGDIVAHERKLPLLSPGDYVLIQDTGAYCFSNHFQYNALPAGAVYGFRSNSSGEFDFELIRAAQTSSDILQLFN